MKRDEPYNPNPNIKSPPPSTQLIFRPADAQDRDAVTALMAERNPQRPFHVLLKTTDREIGLNSSDPDYRLFVAELKGMVVGLCRYYHSEGLPKEKRRFPAPQGWYCMGLLVDKSLRRQGIAQFLFEERLKSLRERGASEVFSFVDADNPTSVKMHQKFGFEEIARARGFLQISFDRLGILYRRAI